MINGFYLNNNEIQFAKCPSLILPFPKLHNSQIWEASGEWGQIIVQNLNRIKYGISLTFFELSDNSQVEIRPKIPGLVTTTALKNKLYQIVCGAGKTFLNEHQFVSTYGTALRRYMQLKRMEQTIALEMNWSDDMLKELFPEGHPYWSSILIQKDNTYPTLIGDPYRVFDEELKAVLHEFINTSYSGTFQKDYEQSLLEDCLYKVLSTSVEDLNLNDVIDPIEISKINKSIEYILTNLGKRFTIAEIAEYADLSATTFKMRFRQITGKGVFEFLMHHRFLKIRHDLIHTNKPLKALFKESGYRDVPAFINGFKRQMGCSPAAFRKGKL